MSKPKRMTYWRKETNNIEGFPIRKSYGSPASYTLDNYNKCASLKCPFRTEGTI